MLNFSTKVSFKRDGREHIGMICEVLKDKTYKVITTGRFGNLWTIPENDLTIIKTKHSY